MIVLSYAPFEEADLDGYEPIIVHVDAANRQVDVPPGTPAFEGVPATWEA